MTTLDTTTPTGRLESLAPTDTEQRLRRYNLVMGLAHAVQAVLMVVLSNDFSLPVTATYLDGPPGPEAGELTELFQVRLGPAIAAFLGLSAVFHFLVASPWGFPRYVAELRRHQNRFRWVEYAFSASLMIVLIALLPGISDIAALMALFGVNAAMILFGWEMETRNDPAEGRVDWAPFVMGCLAGIVPWIAIGTYIVSPGNDSSPPGFVYGIFGSIFVLFNCFAVNQWLQYRRIGPWRRYAFGEGVYVLLSLVAKSALAWQIFGNTLIG